MGYSERTDAVIEPKLSAQWFLKMGELAAKALDEVESGRIKFIPDKYRNTYRHWMENARDWCISRQLWWGQRIPAYYLKDGSVVVEETFEKALEAARKIDPGVMPEDLRQDEDVLDTWFSSWLWPISVFDPARPGHPEHKPNADLSYYYPTSDLVTGPDIIFFWVARMIMAGGEFMDEKPFSNVYFTGIVRDKLGRKMSKTLGNSPDPLDLIKTYGADAVRIGMLLCSSAGNDIFYDESQVEQGRNFCGKIWNSFRLIQGWKVEESLEQSEVNSLAVKWFENKFPYYKAGNYELDAEGKIWHSLAERGEDETIMYQPSPVAGPVDEKVINDFEYARETVVAVRGIRQQKNIPPKEALGLKVKGGEFPAGISPLVEKLSNVASVEQVASFDGFGAGVSAFCVVVTAGVSDLEEQDAVTRTNAASRKAEIILIVFIG